MADIRIVPGSSIMSFTSSLNFTEKITQDASGSLNLYGSGSTGRTELFSIDGNNGRLFTVSDDLSDSLFSVNTIAGLPVIEAFANNTVVMGQYGTNALVVSGSKVGISTTSPSEKLEVNGNIKFGDGSYNSTLNQAGIAKITSTFTDQSNVQFYGHTGGAVNNLIMTLRGGGNVGIGTTSPAAKTQIFTDRYNDNLTFNSTAGFIFGGSIRQLSINTNDTPPYSISLQGKTSGNTAADIVLQSQGGLVGIGNTSPSYKLDISGTGNASSDFRAPIFYDSNNTGYYVDPASTSNLYSLSVGSSMSLFGGYGGGSGPGLGFENQSTFCRLAFFGLDFYDWNDGIQMTINNNHVAATNSFRAPIFYDSNDTGYYLDPASTSNLYGLTVNQTITGNISGNASKLNPLSGDSNYKLAYTADGARTNAGEWGRAVMYYVPNGQTYGIRVDRADYADNAGTVGGYAASSLWRSDGGTWNPSANITLNQSANSQEWSFDIYRNGYTGGYWQVWDSANNTMLKVDATSGKVYAPYNFVGNLEGNAATATKLQTARTIGGVSFDGTANINLPGVNAAGNQSTTGNAATATTLQTARNINGTSFNGSADINVTEWIHSNRDFVNGTLITTNIDYSVTNGDPFIVQIRGNSYGSSIPFDIQLQGYIYNNTIINSGGYSTGPTFNIIAMNVGGNLCFWFARQSYWQGFNVHAYSALGSRAVNRVQSITDVSNPNGSKQVTFTPVQVLRSDNYNSYSPTLTGGNASGTWGINISGNATTATTATALSSMNISQFTNNSGYITGITSGMVTTALGYTPMYQASRSGINVNAFNDTGLYRGSTGDWTNKPTVVHNGGALLQIDTHPGSYHSQLFFDTGGDRLYFRNANAGTWGSWLTMLHSGNYNSYSPSLTGSGASGTWGINISGNASTATTATTTTGNAATATKLQTARTIGGVSFDGTANIDLPGVNAAGNQNTTGNAATATNSSQLGGIASDRFIFGDNANGRSKNMTNNNANTSDSTNSSGFYFGNNVTGMPSADWWNWLTVAGASWSGTDGYRWQMIGSFWSDDFRVRRQTSGTWQSWKTFILGDVWYGNTYIGANGAIYGTIFYDSNNSAYYVDPASTSNLLDVTTNSLGVGTAAPGTAGLIRATNDIVAYYSSDRRLKDNIAPISNPLEKISQIGGYEFDWNDNQDVYEGHDVGVIAQEIEEILPEIVTTRDNGYKAVKYEKIVPLLIEAIKEQQKQIDELKELIKNK